MSDYIEIPPQQLSKEVLEALIEEFITREGTDYGMTDFSLEEKVEQVKEHLRAGRAVITYDPATESCTLLSKE